MKPTQPTITYSPERVACILGVQQGVGRRGGGEIRQLVIGHGVQLHHKVSLSSGMGAGS